MSYSFFLYQSPSWSLCTVFDSVSSNKDEVLSVNPSANVFISGDFNVYHKDWLTYSGVELIDLVNSIIILISQTTLTMVKFPTWIPYCDSHSPALSDLFLSSEASICSAIPFPPLQNSDHGVVSVSIDVPSNSQWDIRFYCIAYNSSHADWDSLCDHLREVPWKDILKLSASAAACEFC